MQFDRRPIDFHQLAKPANLNNSAVLRMLEEEEARGRGQGLKKVAWPPPREEAEYLIEEPAPVYAQAPGSLQSTPPQPVQQTYRPAPQPTFSPPPSTIILRASPPISQPSPVVYASQPITATVQGGSRSRGDQKWPPESVKQQTAVENEARIAIAKGPAFRPRKVKKDYAPFFAQHALNSTYPGYRPPPGTQHYIEDGTSNL